MTSLQDIERAIDGLQPQELAELYKWLDQHRHSDKGHSHAKVFDTNRKKIDSIEQVNLLHLLDVESRLEPRGTCKPERPMA